MVIKRLEETLRPREKALRLGITNLTDVELLAIILRTGKSKINVKVLANNVLDQCGGLKNLENVSYEELIKVEGIGNVKALEILAIFEINKRIRTTRGFDKYQNEKQLLEYIHNKMKSLTNEEFWIVISKDKEILEERKLFVGNKSTLNIDIPRLLSIVVLKGGTELYCFHNHPSNSLLPSDQDISFTKKINGYKILFNLHNIKHFIMTSKSYAEIK